MLRVDNNIRYVSFCVKKHIADLQRFDVVIIDRRHNGQLSDVVVIDGHLYRNGVCQFIAR